MLDFKATNSIVPFIFYFALDYCHLLYYRLSKSAVRPIFEINFLIYFVTQLHPNQSH